jgi:hypothetical protein
VGRLKKLAIYKVGYKSVYLQCIRMATNQKSSLVHCPAIHNHAKRVISSSNCISDSAESLTGPGTDVECFSLENQLGLPENRAWLYHSDSNISEASGKVSNIQEASSKVSNIPGASGKVSNISEASSKRQMKAEVFTQMPENLAQSQSQSQSPMGM